MHEIYIKGQRTPLEVFIELVKGACGIEGWEQRFSDNWPGGTYFISRAFGIEIKAMAADNVAFPDYDFWIIVSSNPKSRWLAAAQHDADRAQHCSLAVALAAPRTLAVIDHRSTRLSAGGRRFKAV